MLKILESQLKAFKIRAFPFATQQTVNNAAFKTRSEAQENIRNFFINRNKFTERSIRVDKTRSLDVNQQISRVGSIADYMRAQENGATLSKRGGVGIPIPTSFASGEGENTRPRRRLPRGANKLSAIRLSNRSRAFGSKKQAAAVAVKQAVKSGNKFVYMELQKTRGIYKLVGTKRNLKIKMVYDLTRPSVIIHAKPWLLPAAESVGKQLPEIYFKALKQQLERHGLLKNI